MPTHRLVRLVSNLALAICLLGGPTFASAEAQANDPDASWQLEMGDVESGVKASYGYFSGVRLTVKIRTFGGQIETRHLLISSDALLQIESNFEPSKGFGTVSRSFQIGAFDVLLKGGHIGLGFKGITTGYDLDRQYSDLLKTGLHVIINLIRSEKVRLDIKSGYELEKLRINANTNVTFDRFPHAVAVRWHNNWFSGHASAMVDINPIRFPDSFEHVRYMGVLGMHADVLTIDDLVFGLGFALSHEHDVMRQTVSLAPDLTTAMLSIDVRYEVHKK